MVGYPGAQLAASGGACIFHGMACHKESVKDAQNPLIPLGNTGSHERLGFSCLHVDVLPSCSS